MSDYSDDWDSDDKVSKSHGRSRNLRSRSASRDDRKKTGGNNPTGHNQYTSGNVRKSSKSKTSRSRSRSSHRRSTSASRDGRKHEGGNNPYGRAGKPSNVRKTAGSKRSTSKSTASKTTKKAGSKKTATKSKSKSKPKSKSNCRGLACSDEATRRRVSSAGGKSHRGMHYKH